MIVAPEQVPDIIAADPDDNAILSGTYQGIPILDGLHFLYVVRGDRLPDTTAGTAIHPQQGGLPGGLTLGGAKTGVMADIETLRADLPPNGPDPPAGPGAAPSAPHLHGLLAQRQPGHLRQLVTTQPEQATLFDACDEGRCWT